MSRRLLPLAIPLCLLLAHGLGGKQATSAIAGIATEPGSAFLGLVYALLWFATWLAIPIWALTLVGAAGLRRWARSDEA